MMFFLLLINSISFAAAGADKYFAVRRKWRISEKTFLLLSAAGGGAGTLLAFYLFRHKTRHNKLLFSVWLITVVEMILFVIVEGSVL